MATVYKWVPGHYILGAGNTKDLAVLLDGIAGTGTNNIPNIVGVQIRYVWNKLEIPDPENPTAYKYTFTPILNDLQTLKTRSDSIGRKLYLRILVQFKGIGGRGAPKYLWDTADPAYKSEYGIGVYTWGNTGGGGINEHPALWIPAVEDRLTKFMQAMGAALDSVGQPAGDKRYHLSTVDFNETSWGKNGDTALTSDQQNKQRDALLRIQTKTKAAFPTTIVGHFVNFPTLAVNTMCAPMVDNGITLGGPDTWWDDSSVENGVYQKYQDAWGKTAISPSVQNQNWEFKKHADVNPPVYYIGHLLEGTTPTLQKLYDRVTTAGVTVDGVFRAGLRGTHITWQGATWALHNEDGSLSSIKPWNLIRDFFLNKWNSPGADFHNVTPGVITDIPSKLLTGAPAPPPPPPPGSLVIALTTDTGASSADKITSNAAVTVTGATSGATLEYATSESGPWSTTLPAPTQGSNTWYVRQVVSGAPSVASAPLTFIYDTTVPVLSMATVDGATLFLAYDDAVGLSNTLRAPISSFSCKVNGSNRTISGNFVNEALRRINLTLASAVTEGQTVTISYTKPATGTAFTQDLAGNAAVNLVDAPVTNLTGVTAPTTTVTIASAGGVADGGATNQATPTIVGTLSAPLATGESLEIQRAAGAGSFNGVGTPTATDTDWTFADVTLAEGAYSWRSRVRLGDLLGSWSATLTINVDTTPPEAPTATGATVAFGAAAVISGSWSNGIGETLAVSVGSTVYTTSTGLTVSGTSWSVTVSGLASGYYDITARTSDQAGNAAINEEPAQLVVLPQPSINHARLAMARRRH